MSSHCFLRGSLETANEVFSWFGALWGINEIHCPFMRKISHPYTQPAIQSYYNRSNPNLIKFTIRLVTNYDDIVYNIISLVEYSK